MTIDNSKKDNFPFNSNTTDYDSGNAYSLSLVSQLVYRRFREDPLDKLLVQNQAESWGFDDVYFFYNEYNEIGAKKDSEAIVLINSESIIVAFRGSENDSEDWKNNAKFRQQNHLVGKVHRGFYKAFTDVWLVKDDDTQIEMEDRLLKEMKGNKRTLWLTGHSLGGAMATLAAASCKFSESNRLNVSGVYTYGQPRVGDIDFATKYNFQLKEKTFRIVNNNDVIARIPNVDYEHVGTLKFINSRGDISDEDLSWLRTIYSLFTGRFQDFGKRGTAGIIDHSLHEDYIPKLRYIYKKLSG